MSRTPAALAGLCGLLAGLHPSFAEEPVRSYLLHMTGIACVTTPCPVWEALDVQSCEIATFDGVDLSAIAVAEADQRLLYDALSRTPTIVEGAAFLDDRPPPPDLVGPIPPPLLLAVTRIVGEPDGPVCQP